MARATEPGDRAALEREMRSLYELAPGEFTAARNARAKKLKATDPELAAAVAKLSKPTAAAGAVNRLARDEPSEVRALVQSGRRLRAAQEAAVAGGKTDLPQAIEEHREALSRVQREARKLSLSSAVLERAIATLRAASIDPELQPLLERGILAAEVEPGGFGIDPGLVATTAKPRQPRAGQTAAQKRAEQAARKTLEKARATYAAAKKQAREADKRRRAAEQDALDAAELVRGAAEAVERAEQTLADITSRKRAYPD